MKTFSPVFLSQSYHDAWDDYIRSLNRKNFIRWDYVILTASNEYQAEGFRAQLHMRQDAGYLPKETKYAVVADPNGKRVGSGGATLNVIRYLAEQERSSDFQRKRILVIHSGGDSKRIPQYSALGKIFSPVPHCLPDGRASTLFDEFMISMSGMPGRIREGMLLLSGDVLLMYNCLQVDFPGKGAAAISFKEDVQFGKDHGVYLLGKDGNVKEFLHKQPIEILRKKGAVNEQDNIDIDTGAVLFSTEILSALFGLIARDKTQFSEKATKDEIVDVQCFDRLVNEEIRLSLYGDFLYPMASHSSLEKFYLEKTEGTYCKALKEARTLIWYALRPFRMRLLRLSPAKFIHFGTNREIMQLLSKEMDSYSYFSWNRHVKSSAARDDISMYNSSISKNAYCGENTYLEVSHVHSAAHIGKNVILSYVDIDNEKIPDQIVLHGLKQRDGKFVVRIFGINDNPKAVLEEGCYFLGIPLKIFMERNGLKKADLWEKEEHSLWMANLYPACRSFRKAMEQALNLYALVYGTGNLEQWRNTQRKSLCSGFYDADSEALIAWNERMEELVYMERLYRAIEEKECVENVLPVFKMKKLSGLQQEWLKNQVQRVGFSEAIRLYYYTGKTLGGKQGEGLIDQCFSLIRSGVLEGTLKSLNENTSCKIGCSEHIVRLPLRVNWGGGWSDTPPYCNECGGTVLNVAISLKGQLPVKVVLKKLDEKKIIFDSQDMNTHGEFTSIEELQSCEDLYDPFILQKAALLVCGVIPQKGGNLEKILARIGGGLFMSTSVDDVPQGSGLGTSSILAGACMKALFEFLDIPYTRDELYARVLCMEQIMSTGGGWQDQVGGLCPGIKYITSRSGMYQKLRVTPVILEEETKQELKNRFALIYTGQRRLARNLLRDVIGRYIGNVPEAVDALKKIQRIAALMRFELERGDIDAFARLLTEHWKLSCKLDKGSTNTCIEQIFCTIDHLIEGRMICGAGGGGFLQVILKKGITKKILDQRLHEVFQDNGVNVWECEFVFDYFL